MMLIKVNGHMDVHGSGGITTLDDADPGMLMLIGKMKVAALASATTLQWFLE